MKKKDVGLFEKLKILEKKVSLKNKIQSEKPFRFNNLKVKEMRQNKTCVVCGESRVLEYAHIIPVAYLKRISKEYQELANTDDNGLFLCKNHHWCFDHRLLTSSELDIIFINKKDFINNVLLEFANMSHKENPSSKITATDKKVLKNFTEWLQWVSNTFFIKNI